MFAVQAHGHAVTTVEGLTPEHASELHPLQTAFRQSHALQCGFCTPGILMTIVALLRDHPDPSEREIRDTLSGNLCRCTGYQNIVDAVKLGRDTEPVTPRYLGERVLRNEDARLLTGRALFVDDVQLPGMLHVAFVRSNHAHGRLRGVDVSAARRRPGVAAVYTAADLGDYWRPGPLLVPPPPIEGLVFHPCTQVPLVKDKVRHVGEPIAMVVAESRYAAEDALEDVLVDIEPIDAVVDLEAAIDPAAPLIHEHLTSNVAAHVVQRKGDYQRARAQADVVIRRRFLYDRGAAAAIENRVVVASWDARAEELTIWDTTQAPIPIRNGLAQMLGLLESQVTVIAPFVGGGFGPKIMMFYPEEVLVPWAARRLGAPIKWAEDRQENFLATTQERGQIHDAEIAFSREGRILGVRDVFLHDSGAYDTVRPDDPDQQSVHAARSLRHRRLRE